MIGRLIRNFPRIALITVVLVGSTALFGMWWLKYRVRHALYDARPELVEDIRPKVEKVEAKHERLLLVDNDLYDFDNGALVFQGWLKKGSPMALFYDAEAKKIIGRYEPGFVRYSLDGTEEAVLVQTYPPVFADDLKWVVYAKDKDLWRADINWREFKFANEKRLTSVEQFNERFFAQNVLLGTDHIFVVRNMNSLLRVNFDTGAVKPTRLPAGSNLKRRSPQGRFLPGVENGRFYCYDVDSEDSKGFAVNGIVNDCLWLENERCVLILGGKRIGIYDCAKNTLEAVTDLPVAGGMLSEPSPSGRYLFATGFKGETILLDLIEKNARLVKGGDGVTWISPDTFTYSREVPDSELRGMWMQKVGEAERRVSPQPYLVGKGGAMLMVSPAGLVVYATKDGLSRINVDGTEPSQMIKLRRAPVRVMGMAEWKL